VGFFYAPNSVSGRFRHAMVKRAKLA
jgi:hypothetical protein